MHLMKYYGREINLVEAYDQFCLAHKKDKITDATLRAWFLKALAELKYCGLISATRQ